MAKDEDTTWPKRRTGRTWDELGAAAPELSWQYLRSLRASPPAFAGGGKRASVFRAALEQSEQLFGAAATVDYSARPIWVGGGWGVTTLVGRLSREHRDLDIAIDADDLQRCLRTLNDLGYLTEVDWLRARDAGIRHVVLATSYRADVFADALETALSTACKACKWTTRSVPTPSAGSSTRRPAGTGR